MPLPRFVSLLIVLSFPLEAMASSGEVSVTTAHATNTAISGSETVGAAVDTHEPAASFGDARDSKAWAELAGIAGTWALVHPATDAQRAFRVSYRLLPNASALVEIYGDPAGRFTQTVFHPDGDRIIATHYCAQGNQPRLQLTATDGPLAFTFLDATNLPDTRAAHLTRLQLHPEGAALTRVEVYTSAEGNSEDALQLHRVE